MNSNVIFNHVNCLLKGIFHDTEAKWDLSKEFRHFYYAAAGNVVVRVEVEVYGKNIEPEKAPNAKAIANSILAKLPKNAELSVESKIQVDPRMTVTGDANENGLIPAPPLLYFNRESSDFSLSSVFFFSIHSPDLICRMNFL